MRRTYRDYATGKFAEYGSKFDETNIAENFKPYFESGERIEVKLSWGEVKRGRVSVTTGCKPSFLLMLTQRSLGSSILLTKKDRVLKVICE